MGFDVGGNTAVLEFEEGTALDGAEVRVSLDMSVRDFLALQRTIAGMTTDAAALDGSMLDRWEAADCMFARTALRSWNLENGGIAVEASEDGFLSLPFAAANAIFTAWARALGGPGPNSNGVSASGDSLGALREAMAAG